jgi:hypothetical protein
MDTLPQFPESVHKYVEAVFASANRRVCEKIMRVPNCSEPSLDTTFVEAISQFGGPQIVEPGWAVRIDVHFIGGLRHWRQWEIADIGLMVFARKGTSVVTKKVALLQSKRLYPKSGAIHEESLEDYRIGMGNLLPSQSSSQSLSLNHTFEFSNDSKYRALSVKDDQYHLIDQFESSSDLPVEYLFYNPWSMDAAYSFPLGIGQTLGSESNGGCRVVPATILREAMNAKRKGYSPSFLDITSAMAEASPNQAGWRVEHYVSDHVLRCKRGKIFEGLNQENIFNLFNRRSGPIAAALSITIEQLERAA